MASFVCFIGATEGSAPKKPSAATVRSDVSPAAKPQAPAASKKLTVPDDGLPDEKELPDAIEEPAEETGPASEDYAPDVSWMRTAKFVEYVQFTSAVRAMLVTDWQEAKGGPRHAQSHFETARKLHGEDPRLYFAYGLVLWKHQEREQAIAQFERGAKTGKIPFLPALQAAAWCRIWQRDANHGGAHLLTLAHALTAAAGEHPSVAQKQRTADWLGQTVGYLTDAGRTPGNADGIARLEQTMDNLLEGPLREAFAEGRDKSRRLFAELKVVAARPESDLRLALGDRRQKLLGELASVEPELAAGRDALKRNRESLAQSERNFRIGTRQFKFAQVEFSELPARVAYLSIAHGRQVEKKVREFEKDKGDKGDKEGKWVTKTVTEELPETDAERQTRLAQRQQSIDRYNALEAGLPQMATELRMSRDDLADTRRNSQREHREQFGRVAEFSVQERRLKILIQQYLEWEKSPARFREHIRSLPPYVPWSVEDDKERVLESYPRRVPVK